MKKIFIFMCLMVSTNRQVIPLASQPSYSLRKRLRMLVIFPLVRHHVLPI